ncbi:unnamed protein product, partial [Rhizoctonia solani]
AGEQNIGVLVTSRSPARISSTAWDENITQNDLCALVQSADNQPHLILGDISHDTMNILKSSGLSELYPSIFEEYDQSVQKIHAQWEQDMREGEEKLRSRNEHDKKELQKELQYMVLSIS